MLNDTYKEVKNHTTGIYKEKGSKFIAYSYPVYSEDQVKEKLEEVKKLEYAARHHCYGYILHADKSAQRANDDGEPSSTAGKPILGQILSNDLTNILVVVVRYCVHRTSISIIVVGCWLHVCSRREDQGDQHPLPRT